VTSSILDNVEHWRGRAKAARLVANHLDDPVAKAAMPTIAEQYDRIADQAQVRSHDEAPKASKGQDGSTAEEPCPTPNLRGGPRRQSRRSFPCSPHRPLKQWRAFRRCHGQKDDPFVREVSVHPDCEGGSHWLVEWGDSDGGCYVTTFDGSLAEQRARAYFDALKSGALKVIREGGRNER
jgi:hypothetical protein